MYNLPACDLDGPIGNAKSGIAVSVQTSVNVNSGVFSMFGKD